MSNFGEYSDGDLRDMLQRLERCQPSLVLAARTEPAGSSTDRRRLIRCNEMIEDIRSELDRRAWVRAGKSLPAASFRPVAKLPRLLARSPSPVFNSSLRNN